MQKEGQNKLYSVLENYIPKSLGTKNKAKAWKYGYDEKHDIVVISKSGQIENVIQINGLKNSITKSSSKNIKRDSKKTNSIGKGLNILKNCLELKAYLIGTQHQLLSRIKWVDYIETEFDRREDGFWFYNNGVKTYITGSHYMYLQWTKIDIGYPNYREANRIFYYTGKLVKQTEDHLEYAI